MFKELGKRLRTLRKQRGYSQEDMLSFGFSTRHWQQIEAGRPFTLRTLFRICDAFFLDNDQTISLWGKRSGFDPAGLDYLIERSKGYYDRRQRDRTLMKGDRVAVLGRGIAVVERTDETEVHALLRNRIMLRIARKCIRWDGQNMRWETDANSAIECLVKPI